MGRGHTDTDLAVYVPDAATWIVGDLIEESGPPMYGSGCFPMDWPSTVAGLLTEIGSSDVVIPATGFPSPASSLSIRWPTLPQWLTGRGRCSLQARVWTTLWPNQDGGPSPSRDSALASNEPSSPLSRQVSAGPRLRKPIAQ